MNDNSVAYYNEIDPEAAAWLRELIKRNLIAPGDVDERDIRDVLPTDVMGYTQCHWFGGVGVWSYALRQAGWSDSRSVWTGSPPCQSFSTAGGRKGFADERHLWPSWLHLISQCRPATLFGEQVASSDSKPWLDLVHTDLEALGYAVGPIVLPAAGFGAPHPRHRIYFVADAIGDGRGSGGPRTARATASGVQGTNGQRERVRPDVGPSGGIVPSSVGVSGSERRERRQGTAKGSEHDGETPGRIESVDGPFGPGEAGPVERGRPGPTNGRWRDADWLRCTDGLWRSARPGSFPLVDGASSRVVRSGDPGEAVDAGTAEARAMRLRGYGNAICVEAAKAFVEAYLSSGE